MRKVYATAAKYEGTAEWKDGHNPRIVKWFKEVGHDWVDDDETPWCAAFAGAMLKEAGLPHTGQLNARSYLDWGEPVELSDAKRGDVVIFSRGDPNGWQGHVAFLDRAGDDVLFVLGGNQENKVKVRAYSKDRLLGIRRMDTGEPEPLPATSAWWMGPVKAFLSIFGGSK